MGRTLDLAIKFLYAAVVTLEGLIEAISSAILWARHPSQEDRYQHHSNSVVTIQPGGEIQDRQTANRFISMGKAR